MFGRATPRPTLGRYVLVRKLGAGAAGVIHEAYDPELDRRVAIKLIEIAGGRQSRLRLAREARAVARLSHPNVVRVFDVGGREGERIGPLTEDSSGAFLVMELVEGVDLRLWLAAGQRSVEAIVRLFVRAGQGLAAAHEAGIVHRDFKPANVLVGAHGEVKVADFGLATLARDGVRDGVHGDSRDEQPSAVQPLAAGEAPAAALVGLTHTGTTLGTPAYMSPEQWSGGEVDARSDQFSFCAALFEALYGFRPFPGDEVEELREAVLAGELRDGPREAGVPGAVRAALMRGLSRAPEERFASMAELIAILDPDRRRRRRAVVVAAVVTLLVAVGAAALSWVGREREQARIETACSVEAQRIATHWDAARRGEVEAVLAGEDAEGIARVTGAFEQFAGQWSEARCQLCLDARLHGRVDASHEAKASACFAAQRATFGTVVDTVVSVEGFGLHRAIQAAVELPRLAECTDPQRLAERPRLPEDPALRERVVEGMAGERRVAALEDMGRYAEGLDAAEAELARARELGWDPLTADLLTSFAALAIHADGFDDAKARAEQALHLAGRSGHDEGAARAAAQLVVLAGQVDSDLEAALRWAQLGDMFLARQGLDDTPAKLLLTRARGLVLGIAGEHGEAQAQLEQAESLAASLYGSPSTQVARVQDILATLALTRSDPERAKRYAEQAIAAFETLLGAEHPELIPYLASIADIELASGELDRAGEHYHRALAIAEAAQLDNQNVIAAKIGLADLDMSRERFEPAMTRYLDAIATIEATLGPEHARLIYPLSRIAELHFRGGAYEAARKAQARALELTRATTVPDSIDVALAELQLGHTLTRLGQLGEARELIEAAQARYARIDVPPGFVADAQIVAAELAWTAGERRQALRLAALAREVLAAAPPMQRERLDEFDAWLRDQGYAGDVGEGEATP